MAAGDKINDEPKIPQLTDAYHKARKQFGLFSGLLIAWELVGIELIADKPPVSNVNVTLKSPQAIPYVLIALIFYFAFRTAIEWYQSDARRRALLASRLDFYTSASLGVTAIVLYGYQRATAIQVADYITLAVIGGIVVGVAGLIAVRFLLTRRSEHKVKAVTCLVYSVGIVGFSLSAAFHGSITYGFVLGISAGALIPTLLFLAAEM